ncbi:UDP-glucuronosyltransferase-like [Synchiropus picturatus]
MGSWVWFQVLAGLCCLSLGPVLGGKVLVVPVDGSHWLSMKILVKELHQRGHDMVVLVPETSLLIGHSESYRTVVWKVPYTKEDLDQSFDSLRHSLFLKPPGITDLFVNVQRLVNFTKTQATGCETLLHDQVMMAELRAEGFDAVLTDPFLPCGSILARTFSIPAVYFLRGLPCGIDLKANQCPAPLSYVPLDFTGNTDVMTFPQRLLNVAMFAVESYVCHLCYDHFGELASRYFGESMSYKDLLSHGAIWLLRYDFALEWPRPIMPNMVFIGGINCVKKNPLPADLQEFVDGSGDDGFIVFTLGSMVSNMPADKAKHFFDAFSRIPQRVIWRFTGEAPKNVSKNVRLMKWIPQNDLLAHPKAKVFITHGGTHGIYEGVCNAVPMLMFPLFGDQGDNVHKLVIRGVAEKLSIFDVNGDSMVAALKKLIYDQSYKEKMAELSAVHLDRPVPPLEQAVFWTEFVMRHKGAEHLRVSAHDLNWIQYHSLDVIGFILLVIVTVLFLTLKCCLFLGRKCCGRATAKRKSE